MKSIVKIVAATALSLSLLFTGEMAEAKKSTHKKTVASHSQSKSKHSKSSKSSKKDKHVAKGSGKKSQGYAKASSYMDKRKPANAHSKKKHSKKTKSTKKKHRRH
jgi:hypothetical protein